MAEPVVQLNDLYLPIPICSFFSSSHHSTVSKINTITIAKDKQSSLPRGQRRTKHFEIQSKLQEDIATLSVPGPPSITAISQPGSEVNSPD
jgi:hypothetical protein